jgi:hypothetical protein
VRPLLLLVKILAEINDPADRRLGLGRDFNQVIASLARNGDSLLRRHNAHLLSLFINHAHFFYANTFIDADLWASVIAPSPIPALITVADKFTSVEISNPESQIRD